MSGRDRVKTKRDMVVGREASLGHRTEGMTCGVGRVCAKNGVPRSSAKGKAHQPGSQMMLPLRSILSLQEVKQKDTVNLRFGGSEGDR